MLFSMSYKWLHFECNCHFKSVLQSIYCLGVCQSQALPLDTLLSPVGFAGIDLEPYILTVKSQCTRPIIHWLRALILIASYSVFHDVLIYTFKNSAVVYLWFEGRQSISKNSHNTLTDTWIALQWLSLENFFWLCIESLRLNPIWTFAYLELIQKFSQTTIIKLFSNRSRCKSPGKI